MILKTALILIVALLHFYFLVLEMFLWTRPLGRKIFGTSAEKANETAALAANQGLYNGFLATGLLWSLLHPQIEFAQQLAVFFLNCVIVAALYGSYSVSRKILWVQGLPGALALAAVLFL